MKLNMNGVVHTSLFSLLGSCSISGSVRGSGFDVRGSGFDVRAAAEAAALSRRPASATYVPVERTLQRAPNLEP